MKNSDRVHRPLTAIAGDFFGCLGRQLPHLCASDEFYFLPRSEAAVLHLHRLDHLSADTIQDLVRHVKGLLAELANRKGEDLEGEIDRLLLQQSMESFVREFADAQAWRKDPTIYIKIPLFATDQILSRVDGSVEQTKSDLSGIFAQIPGFLREAAMNLASPSAISLEVAKDMVQDAIYFYSQDLESFIVEKLGGDKELLSKNKGVLVALEQFNAALCQLPVEESFAVGEEGLGKILATSLSYFRSPAEIIRIARDTFRETRERVREAAARIDAGRTWNALIYDLMPTAITPEEVMRLYQREVGGLRRFFYANGIIDIHPDEGVRVIETPSYLKSLRATASYRAPLTGRQDNRGVFFVTPGKEDLGLISVHSPYLCAHETYPGHHVLDNLRINHSNPIRRQIESPLYYEGWSCYAEQLLDELGYIQEPRVQLVGLQRRLWRSLRAALDVELQTGRITLAQGAEEIAGIGYSPERARRQMRRFALTPGYQLCYFMGNYEILRLRQRFSSQLPLKAFHAVFLNGGQLPFHLIERRLEKELDGQSDG
jgi:hypothetical protein